MVLLDIFTDADFYNAAIRLTTPLLLAAMGGLFSERAGVLNLGLEGMMLMGAFFGYLGAFYSHSVLIGLVVAALCGGLLALLHAYLSITVKVDQIVTAVGLNMLALGITSTFFRLIFGMDLKQLESPGMVPVNFGALSKIPFIGHIFFEQVPLVYLAVVLVLLVNYILYHTSWGLSIRAAGEHPKALDVAGIDVVKVRYLAVVLSGFLSGLGGAAITLSGINTFYDNITAGRGFIAFAAIVFGKWTAAGTAMATLLFGAGEALQLRLQAFNFQLPYQFFLMLPYALTLIVLIFFMGPAKGPAASGLPYIKDKARGHHRRTVKVKQSGANL
ncbi:Branched-chain amino acid transport system / permease component [Neomoorella glycerini]|uniref:Branched-chain amino acid transport system / permease component n=1 Tax=Neomoorella glycerini TaxID=55779 RepID=A0A6I5ZMN1_9FIRM|nr:ABC transporter permease [Moorella glycerini]QGP91096.1 Branched-chain amino acid transport system / permease component [Moorella glycerini]